MAYHCASYYNTGLIIYQLPGSQNTKASTIYISSHVYSQASIFQQYHFPQHNHIYNIISCYSNHPSNIILSSQLLNPLIHNTNTYICYQQFHNHKYIPMSSTSIYHYNFFNQYLTNSFTYIFMHISTLSCYHISIHNTNLIHSSISIHQHISYSQYKSHALLNINSTSCHYSQYKSYAFFNINSSTYFHNIVHNYIYQIIIIELTSN